MATVQKITPNLWFNNQAEEAVQFYTSIFRNSSIGRISRYGKEGIEIHKMPEGTILTIEFELEGQSFLALNGGPIFQFNEAISLIINCDTQEEVDYYWEKLTDGGDEKAQICGWLKDKFGLSWQVVPTILSDWLVEPVTEKSERVMKEIFKMKKLDLATLKKAYEGENN
jgi:predicted 3-demethylubiquinone-9 3-methyltransferase (glyoxalase superfamily)